MKDEQIRAQIHQAVDAHGEHLRTDPFLAQRIMNQEEVAQALSTSPSTVSKRLKHARDKLRTLLERGREL